MDLISATSLETFSKLLLLIIVVTLLVVFWWRAGSLYSVMERLWRITAGNTPIKNRDLAEFIEKHREIEKFRFIYRLKIYRHEDMQRFLQWHKTNGFPIRDLQFLRNWFDVNEDDFVKVPKKILVIFLLTFTLLIMSIFIASAVLGLSQKAFFHMNESDANFKSNGTTVESLLGGWKLDSSSCDKTGNKLFTKKLEFTESEAKMVCDAFQDGSFKSTVDQAITSQKKIGRPFMGIFGALFSYILWELLTALDARNFPKRLEKFTSTKSHNIRTEDNGPIQIS